MPSIQELSQNPKFWDYSANDQILMLDRVDPRFKELSPDAKKVFLSKLTARTKISPLSPQQDPKQIAARTAGGIAGGLTGAKIGAGVGAPGGPVGIGLGTMIGSIIGTGIGAMSGEGYYQAGQHIAKDPNAPKTVEDAARQMFDAGLEEGLWEAGAQIATRGASKFFKPFAKSVSKEARQSIEWVGNKFKPLFTPAEATESRILDVAQNIAEGSILGGQPISKLKRQRNIFFKELADEITDQFGPKISQTDASDIFLDVYSKKNEIFKSTADAMYNEATNLAKNINVSTESLKKFAAKELKVLDDLSGIGADISGEDLLKRVMELPDEITAQTASRLRSNLRKLGDKFTIENKTAPAVGKAKYLTKSIHENIETALRQSDNTDALEAWQRANTFYKEGTEQFNNAIVRSLVKKGERTPDNIAKSIFQTKSPQKIRKIRSMMGERNWKSMQSYYVQSLFLDSQERETGNILGKRIQTKLNGMGMESLKEIFSYQQLKELKNFTDTLIIAQRKQSEGLGRMWIQLAQGTAAVTFASGAVGGDLTERGVGGGIILFGPAVLSKMLVKPSVARYLTTGLKLPVSSPQVVGISARLMKAAREIQKEIIKEENQ